MVISALGAYVQICLCISSFSLCFLPCRWNASHPDEHITPVYIWVTTAEVGPRIKAWARKQDTFLLLDKAGLPSWAPFLGRMLAVSHTV